MRIIGCKPLELTTIAFKRILLSLHCDCQSINERSALCWKNVICIVLKKMWLCKLINGGLNPSLKAWKLKEKDSSPVLFISHLSHDLLRNTSECNIGRHSLLTCSIYCGKVFSIYVSWMTFYLSQNYLIEIFH